MLGALENNRMNESQNLILYRLQSSWKNKAKYAESTTQGDSRFYKTVWSVIGEGNGTPLQYSCLENPMDGGAWWAAVHGVAKSRTRLSDFPFSIVHWRRKWQLTPVFLPGESQGRQSLVGCCPWGRTELDTTEAT